MPRLLSTASSFQSQDEAITPAQYQSMPGHGMDVDWSKTSEGRANYQTQAVIDFVEAGIKHVRIRVKDDLTPDVLASLDRQIDDRLSHGLIPVLSYQADAFKNDPSERNLEHVVEWWSTIAARYQDKSHALSFDLLIECTDALNQQSDRLNEMIERVTAAIRRTNPDRIIMMSPRLRSNPAYLSELRVPSQANGYLMAEWHFYAAGPSKTNEKAVDDRNHSRKAAGSRSNPAGTRLADTDRHSHLGRCLDARRLQRRRRLHPVRTDDLCCLSL